MRIVNGPHKEEDCYGHCSNCCTSVRFYSSELKYYQGQLAVGADPRYWECPVCKTRNNDWKERT